MGYILGIDQGSSKTQVIIGDHQGNIVGIGKSYGACHSVSGLGYAMEAIRQAVEQAFAESGLAWKDVDTLAAGLTGVDWDYEELLLTKELQQLSKVDHIILKNDCIIAMRAGTMSKFRSVICAGSGMNCAIHKSDQEEFVFGFYIDDDYQGGFGLGRACLKKVFDSAIGLEKETVLTDMLLKHFNAKTVDELLHMRTVREISHDQYLYLPMLLEQAALMNDSVAIQVWESFGTQYGKYVVCGLRRMGLLEEESEVVLSGSIFKCKSPALKQAVEKEIRQYAPKAIIIDAEYEPVVGAYLLGLDHHGGQEFDIKSPILKQSAEKYGLFR